MLNKSFHGSRHRCEQLQGTPKLGRPWCFNIWRIGCPKSWAPVTLRRMNIYKQPSEQAAPVAVEIGGKMRRILKSPENSIWIIGEYFLNQWCRIWAPNTPVHVRRQKEIFGLKLQRILIRKKIQIYLITFEGNAILGRRAQYLKREKSRRPLHFKWNQMRLEQRSLSATRRFAELVKAK